MRGVIQERFLPQHSLYLYGIPFSFILPQGQGSFGMTFFALRIGGAMTSSSLW